MPTKQEIQDLKEFLSNSPKYKTLLSNNDIHAFSKELLLDDKVCVYTKKVFFDSLIEIYKGDDLAKTKILSKYKFILIHNINDLKDMIEIA